ncbi:hypothetical protein ABND71_22950, partial [Paenibacillus larvae]
RGHTRHMTSFGQPKRYFTRIASIPLRLSETLGGTKMEKMIPTGDIAALRNGFKLSETMHYAVLKRGR